MWEATRQRLRNVDNIISCSTFGRVFRLEGSGHVSQDAKHKTYSDNHQEQERRDAKFFTEIRAGLTTFFTMAYIIAVNVSIVHNIILRLLITIVKPYLYNWRNMYL